MEDTTTAAPAPGEHAGTSAGDVVLRVLRVSLHVGFALLLAVGIIRVLVTDTSAPTWITSLALAGVLAAVYLLGTLWENRNARGLAPDPSRYAHLWLLIVVVLWLALMWLHPDFSWLAFPLFFLQLHLLRTQTALIAIVGSTIVVIAAQWAHAGTVSAAAVIGPLFGAAFSVVMGFAYRALHTEGVNQRRALDELRRTRTALAGEQHRAGVLAERERLARDIHDTLAQGFSSIVLVSRSARAALDAGDLELASQRLETVATTASDNLGEARDFVRGLSAGNLEAAAGALAGRFARLCAATERTARAAGADLECRFREDGEPQALPTDVSGALLRTAQSCLANVLAHAGASWAVLSLGYLPGEVTLDVYDDGAGFDPAALPTAARPDGTGFGLLGLRARMAALGGSVDIESAPGEGTVVAVRIPLRMEDGHG
ncbi:sensor histidine kinase [Arthrobacter sp.]|uniref:sensor histidine kinase n=1 Tax=Arthrobacter sp. TaxID=1667 RepID=UPI003A905598